MKILKLLLTGLLVLFIANTSTFGYPGGVSGYTLKTNSNGCGSCHSTHGSLTSSINVVISGPTTLKPNQVGTYKVTISGGSGTKVGVDIACSSGLLAKVDANLKVLNTELTQPSAKSYSGGQYVFNFTYQAPADTGYKTLYSTGMSKKSQWNFSSNFTVHVTQPTITAPNSLTAVYTDIPKSQAQLNWTDNSNNEDYFVVERKVGTNGTFEQLIQLPSNTTQYLDTTNILTSTNYYYRVYAKNADVNSDYSNIAEIFSYLPVEMLSLEAAQVNNDVVIQWSTASELNNSGFAIERNINNGWEKIGFIGASSASSEIKNYSFTDSPNNLPAFTLIKYRLKQMDFNGEFTYYGSIEVNYSPIVNSFSLAQNYPNPFNPSTKITYNMAEPGSVLLKVYDSIGNLVTTLVNEQKQAGSYSVNFNIASSNNNLSSGIYFYTINIKSANGTFTETKKALLLK